MVFTDWNSLPRTLQLVYMVVIIMTYNSGSLGSSLLFNQVQSYHSLQYSSIKLCSTTVYELRSTVM